MLFASELNTGVLMSSIDLSGLSKEELVKLQKDVAKAITSYDDRHKKEALAALEAKARELGFSLGELTGTGKTTGIPKYRNPEDATQTWTGRGRQPAWIKAALSAGKSLDDMLIA